MNILRLSTLSLTLAIAVFSLGYLNPSAARPICPGHPSCKPPSVNPIKYTAELTGTIAGAFVFGPAEVTPDAKETDLLFKEPPPKVSPHRISADCVLSPSPLLPLCKELGDWAEVFNHCDALGPTNIPADELPNDFEEATLVGTTERLTVWFFGIEYGNPPVGITVQLRGTFEDFRDPLLPAAGETSIFPLFDAWVDGQTLNKPKAHCNKRRDRLDLDHGSTLVIKASCRFGLLPMESPPTCAPE